MPKLKILFLCTGNSARSILGEYLLRHKGSDRFESCSAGAAPKPQPHPIALRLLRDEYSIDASDAKSESWEIYQNAGLDAVITVCDSAAQTCPIWPGRTVVAPWFSPDPAHYDGPEDEHYRFFHRVALQIEQRIDRLLALPPEAIDTAEKLQAELAKIGEEVSELPNLTSQT